NLAYNISALRKVLDCGSEAGSMIETVPTRGYRFVAPVRVTPPYPSSGDPDERFETNERRTLGILPERLRLPVVLLLVCVALLVFVAVAAGAVWFWRAHDRVDVQPELVRLTSNPAEMAVTSAFISPDGRYVAFGDP